MAHTHTPDHVTVNKSGTMYEVCNCGATRIGDVRLPATGWHTCKLCTHPYGRSE